MANQPRMKCPNPACGIVAAAPFASGMTSCKFCKFHLDVSKCSFSDGSHQQHPFRSGNVPVRQNLSHQQRGGQSSSRSHKQQGGQSSLRRGGQSSPPSNKRQRRSVSSPSNTDLEDSNSSANAQSPGFNSGADKNLEGSNSSANKILEGSISSAKTRSGGFVSCANTLGPTFLTSPNNIRLGVREAVGIPVGSPTGRSVFSSGNVQKRSRSVMSDASFNSSVLEPSCVQQDWPGNFSGAKAMSSGWQEDERNLFRSVMSDANLNSSIVEPACG